MLAGFHRGATLTLRENDAKADNAAAVSSLDPVSLSAITASIARRTLGLLGRESRRNRANS